MILDDLDDFIDAYKECALWATTDTKEDGTTFNMDDVEADWSEESEKEIREDCTAFVESNCDLLKSWTARQAGGDFFLTRNRHGAGFQDRTFPGAAALAKDAHVYSTQTPYLGDDGKIYLHH
jgi:hypothetical protein